jgi:hypothetical protein
VLSKAIGNSRRYVLILALQVGLFVIYKAFANIRRLCHVLQREEYSGLDTAQSRLLYTGLQCGLNTVDA